MVAGNVVTDMESVSRFKLALIEKKLLARSIFKNAWRRNDFKMFMLINSLFTDWKVLWLNNMNTLELNTW